MELEGRDFTQEMQDEQSLRQRERQMLEDQENKLLQGLPEAGTALTLTALLS